MVRRADELFLKIAVKNSLVSKTDARDILGQLEQRQSAGEAVKARHVCLDRGLMSKSVAKDVKKLVMDALAEEAKKARPKIAKIGKITIGREISRGRLTSLYEGQMGSGGQVRVRVIDSRLLPDAGACKALLKQIKAAQKVRHIGFMPILEFGEHEDSVYVVTELPEATLGERIERGERLDEKDATRLILSLAEALKQASASGVLHGFMTPEQVVRDDTGFRLMDASCLPRGVITRSIKDAAWRAPEQLSGSNYDIRSDIYSLGAVVYHATTGHIPFETIEAIRFDNPMPLPGLARGVTDGLSQMVLQMLAKKPEDRYQSYEAVISDVDNVIAGFGPSLEKGDFASFSVESGLRDGVDAENLPGLKKPATRRGKAIGRKKGPGKRKSRRKRPAGQVNFDESDDYDIQRSGSNLAPAAFGLAAVVFLAALIMFGRGGGPSGPSDDGGPVVDKPNERETVDAVKEALERAAKQELQKAEALSDWEFLRALENIVASYPDTKASTQAAERARPLRDRLEADEKKRYQLFLGKIRTLKTENEFLKAVNEYDIALTQLQGKDLVAQATAEKEALLNECKKRLAAVKREVLALTNNKEWVEAATKLRASLGLRSESDREAANRLVLKYERFGREQRRKAEEARRKTLIAAIEKFEALVRELGPKGDFATIAREGKPVVAAAKGEVDLLPRAEVHYRAAEDLLKLPNLVSASALDLIGKDLNVKRVNGKTQKGRLKDLETNGALVFKIRQGEVIVPRDELSLESQEDIVRLAKREDGRGPLLFGLRHLYLGDFEEARKRLEVARKKGAPEVSYYLARLPKVEKLFNPDKPTEGPDEGPDGGPDEGPDVAVRPRPGPDKNGKPAQPVGDSGMTMQELHTYIFENMRKLFQSASERGYSTGRVDVIYRYWSGTRNVSPLDWDISDKRNVYAQTDRRAVILDRSGSLFHKVELSQDFYMRVRFVFAGTITSRSNFFIVCADQTKPELFKGRFGQQLFHYKKKRLVAREGLGKINQQMLQAEQEHELEIGYKDGELWCSLNGVQHGIIRGLGISRARVGLMWQNCGIQLRQVRIAGFPHEEWVVERVEGKKKKGDSRKR